ncbi:MAG TPA: aspartate aminotransferase family protein [Bryobacteraceae bacterium]|nr:aspartate aminotransferase family protein [Bryobacteraceae bacterium]
MNAMSSVLPVAPEKSAESSALDRVRHLEDQYLLQNYARYPLMLDRGKGCYVYDPQGKRYLDFITGIGVNALGHAHPRLVKALRDQAARLWHTSNLYYHAYQGPLAERLAKASGLERTFFCNSGAECLEGALKMVRGHGHRVNPEKYEIVALHNSFHGRTLGALSITGQEKYRRDFEPLLPGARFVQPNDEVALEQVVNDRTAGIVLEWIQGEGGIFPMSLEYVRKARQLADRYDALLVFDEIQCGVGRTGKHFAYQQSDPVIMPDIMTAAKPLACGIPMGVIVTNQRAAESIGSGMHGSTFGGGPIACRVALEFMDILDELLPHIEKMGFYFRAGLEELQKQFSFIREVRGQGLMIGVDLAFSGKQLVLDAMQQGLLMNCTHDTVLRFLPPYIVTEKEIDRALGILKRLFKKAPKQQTH